MKICVAQTIPVKGDIEANIADHLELIEQAARASAELIIFPELSLTGYESDLAKALATTQDDVRLDVFQAVSDAKQIAIGVGLPTVAADGVCISMVVFRPNQPRVTYSKKHLHDDELPYFVSGKNFPLLAVGNIDVGMAICYELAIPQHAEWVCGAGAHVYVASVAKHARGVADAGATLAANAKQFNIPVLFSNCVGPSDDFVSAGGSAVWNSSGELVGQLGDTERGFLLFDV